MDQMTSFLIMNELFTKKKYDDCLDAYEIYVDALKRGDEAGLDLKVHVNGTNAPLIHLGQFRLLAMSLLHVNSDKACAHIKKVLLVDAPKFNSHPSNKAITCFFLIAINQVSRRRRRKRRRPRFANICTTFYPTVFGRVALENCSLSGKCYAQF